MTLASIEGLMLAITSRMLVFKSLRVFGQFSQTQNFVFDHRTFVRKVSRYYDINRMTGGHFKNMNLC